VFLEALIIMDDSATIFGEEIGRACHMQKGSQGEEQLLVQTPVNSDVVAVSVSGGNLKAVEEWSS